MLSKVIMVVPVLALPVAQALLRHTLLGLLRVQRLVQLVLQLEKVLLPYRQGVIFTFGLTRFFL